MRLERLKYPFPATGVPLGRRVPHPGQALLRLLLLFLLALTPLLSLSPISALRAQAQDAPSGNVVVVLEGRTVPSAVQNIVDAVGFRVAFENVFTGFALTLTQAQANALAQADGVAGIFADRPVDLSDTASTGVQRIGAPSASEMPNPTMVDATVAVIDSGVQADHPNLNVAGGFDAYAAVNAGSGVVCGALTSGQQATYESPSTWGSSSNSGHGTHVAGIIGAKGLNDVVGVAPGASILGVKVFNTAGSGGTTSSIICGLDWVISNQARFGIDAVNMSIQGGATAGSCSSDDLHLAVCSVRNAGIPIVVSAGNTTGASPSIGIFPEAIAVTAFNDYDGLPGGLGTEPCNSTQGTTADDRFATYSLTGSWADIMAPGTCIWSTWVGSSYAYESGTSMAAPHVTGAVALYKSQNPGASPSQVESWIQSVSVPQSDPDGLVVSGVSSGENILHIGDVPNVPDGPFDIAGSSQSSGSSSAANTYDGNMNTAWTTASTTPASGWFYVDLGEVKPIGTVRWVFGSGLGSLADSWQLQASNDANGWVTLANRGNASPKDWKSQTVNVNARYIRFYFTNPNSEPRLGGVAEIEILPAEGETSNLPDPTPTPTPTGPYTIVASASSPGSSSAANTYDGNMSTAWTTASTTPASGWFYVDLGEVKPVGTVRWVFGSGLGSLADSWQLQASNDASGWVTLANRGNASPKAWKDQTVNVNARYIRFYYTNPNSEPRLGGVAEIEVLAATGQTSDLPEPTPTPPGPYAIAGSASSPGSSSASNTYDGNMNTAWTTASNTPASGWFYVDLGSVKPIGTVRYVFGSGLGSLADSWQLQVSNDATNWTTVATRGNASPKDWKDQAVDTNARYVRFLYSNPNVEPRLGGVAEIEILPATGSVASLPTPTATSELTPYAITSYGRSNASSDPTYAFDGDMSTYWITTQQSTPASAYVYFSLGEVKPIGTVRYVFASGQGGYADSWQIQVSNDLQNWKNVATRGNASPKDWKEQVVDVNAMYVRFLFSNPNGDPKLGGIAEVEILPATTTVASLGEPEIATPTTTPTATVPPGTAYALTGAGQSDDSTDAALAIDGDVSTEWITTATSTPESAFVAFSLGDEKPIGDVQWIFTETGWANQYEIQISSDNTNWTTVSSQTDSPAGEWQSITVGQTATYVRFLFSNPTGTAKLGGIGEVRVLGPAETGSPTATAEVTETATATPTEVPGTPVATETDVPAETATPEETATETATVTEEPTEPGTPEEASEGEQPIIESVTENATEVPTDEPTEIVTEEPTEVVTEEPTEVPTEVVTEEPTEEPTEAPWTPGPGLWPAGAGQSDGSEPAAKAFDSDLTTDWRTFDGAGMTEATLTIDLGQVSWVSEAWWYVSANPPGGRVEIEVSSDGETWQVISQPSYLGDPETWVSAPLGIEARYVRFHFYNDDGRSSLGGLAEIVLLP